MTALRFTGIVHHPDRRCVMKRAVIALLGLFLFGLLRLKVNYLFGRIDKCVDALPTLSDLVKKKISIGSLHIPEFHFYAALTLTAAFAEADRIRQKVYLSTLKQHIKKMKQWARFCPQNFEHKMILMEAISRMTALL